MIKLLTELHLEFLRLKGGCTGSSESTRQNATLLEISCIGSYQSDVNSGMPLNIAFQIPGLFPDFTLLKADNDHSHPSTIGHFFTKYSCLLIYSFKKKGIIEKKFF